MTVRYVLAAMAMALGGGAVDAATWRLEMTGFLSAEDGFGPAGTRAALADGTPFTFAATFDDADERTGPVPPGFSVYAPLAATMSLMGATYDILRVGEDMESGVGVALFDPLNPFNTGFWAVGILANPLTSDTGIVARFGATDSGLGVEPAALEATTWSNFRGAGYVSGKPATPGPGDRCWPGGGAVCAIEPFLLTASDGSVFELALASRPYDAVAGGAAFAATLAPVPLPGGLVLLGSVLGLGAMSARRCKGSAGTTAPVFRQSDPTELI